MKVPDPLFPPNHRQGIRVIGVFNCYLQAQYVTRMSSVEVFFFFLGFLLGLLMGELHDFRKHSAMPLSTLPISSL